MSNQIYFYMYKITNLINHKIYIGVHKTQNINDHYKGSGLGIRKAYKKYGKSFFQKQIICFFKSEEQMYQCQQTIVNENIVNDPQYYNMTIGGNNIKTFSHISKLSFQRFSTEQQKKLWMSERSKKIWKTDDIEEKKNKIREGILKYWKTGNIIQKRKNYSNKMKKIWSSQSYRERISNKLKQYWDQDGIKQKRSLCVKNSVKHQKAIQKMRQDESFKGYNNFDFVNRWKGVYQKNMEQICFLLKFSNLPDSFIIKNIFGKKVKIPRILKYYQSIQMLPKQLGSETKNRFLKFINKNNKGHKDGSSKKTFFTNQIKYYFVYLYDDFFEQFRKILQLKNNKDISDSIIINYYNKDIPNYFQVIQYFQQIGIVINKSKIEIKVKTAEGKLVKSSKTIFDIGKKNVILIDKEFNNYEINDNVEPYKFGRIELSVDDGGCVLRHIK